MNIHTYLAGSAALNMCHVASGKLDCYYEDGYGGPWDVAAGFVIVTEASNPLYQACYTFVEDRGWHP